MKKLLTFLCALLSMASVAPGAVIYADLNDSELEDPSIIQETAETQLQVGYGGGRISALYMFDITTITDDLQSATVSIWLNEENGTAPDADLYLLGFGQSATDYPDDYAHYESDTEDPNAVGRIDDNFTVTGATVGEYKTSSDFATLFNDNRPAGAEGNFLFIRINPSFTNFGANNFEFASADTAGVINDPVFTFTVVPEPGALTLIIAGLATTLLIRRRR